MLIDLMKLSKVRADYIAAAEETAARIDALAPPAAKCREEYRSEKTGKIHLGREEHSVAEIRMANFLTKSLRRVDDVWYARALDSKYGEEACFLICPYGAAPFKLAAVMGWRENNGLDSVFAMDLFDYAKLSSATNDFAEPFRDTAKSHLINYEKLDELRLHGVSSRLLSPAAAPGL